MVCRGRQEREEEDAKKRAKEAEEERAGSKRPKILVEDLHPGKHVTTGKAAASFTATGLDLATDAQCREVGAANTERRAVGREHA